jgi:hypothetical protein
MSDFSGNGGNGGSTFSAVKANPISSVVWPIVSVVAGGVVAILGTFGIVSVVGALPPAVDAPYVVYGNS